LLGIVDAQASTGNPMKRLWRAFFSTRDGLVWAGRYETAVTQEMVVLLFAAPLAFWISNSGWVRIALIGSVLLVLIVELINTALEKLCDHLAPELNPNIKVVKDLGSAAVFVTILIAGAIWIYVLTGKFS
jgi:diacylglycerol kinase (ATP)